MNKNLLVRIDENMQNFSKGQRKISEYLLKNYEKSLYLTAAKLAEVIGVSESTVVRFAIELDYDGYPEFQKALEEIVKSELTPRQRMEVTSEKITKGGKHPLRVMMEHDASRISKTLATMDFDEFDTVVEKIANARKIYVIAGRSSTALGDFLYFYLNMMAFPVQYVQIDSKAEIFEQLVHANEEDVCICMSFPRYAKRTIDGMSFAKSRNVTTVAITDSKIAPVTKYCDHVLLSKSDMIAVIDSLVSPLSIINGLLVSLSLYSKDAVLENFDILEKQWRIHDTYETEYYIKEVKKDLGKKDV